MNLMVVSSSKVGYQNLETWISENNFLLKNMVANAGCYKIRPLMDDMKLILCLVM